MKFSLAQVKKLHIAILAVCSIRVDEFLLVFCEKSKGLAQKNKDHLCFNLEVAE